MKLSRRLYALVAIALGVVLFVAVNIVANQWLGTARLDMTQNGLYTVSPGTAATVAKLQEPVTLRFYFSRQPAAGYAQIVAYAGRVRDLLQEYAALSHGKIILEELDPAPFTPAEDDAVAQGLTGAPTQEGDNVYFGLVGTNTLAGHEVIPFFDQSREEYLEYDLTSLIYKLSQPAKPKLGVLTALPLETGAGGLQAALAGNAMPYVAYQQLRDNYDVQMLDPMTTDRIPADVGTLLVVHPANFTPQVEYAIDQFVLKGGHAIVFVDPLSESSVQQGPGAQDQGDKSSSTLGPVLTAWGVDFDPSKVVTDADLAQAVQVAGPGGQPRVIDYIAWMRMTPANFDRSDPITANLQVLNIASAGSIKPHQGATTKFLPLLTSSTTAALMDAIMIRTVQNPSDLLRRFAPTGARFTVGARVTGPAKTAFPNGAPAAAAKPAADPNEPPKPDAGPLPAQIKEAKDINVVIFADSDLLDDRFWVQVQNVVGQRIAVPSADNGALVMNAVENMMGSNDLISLRTRERSARPFVVVDQIRRNAETRFLAEEQQLQQKVTATEASLRALQSPNQATNGGAPVLSKEQQAQIDKFRRDLVQTRSSLRGVQASLRADVERLGTTLAFLNIALVPLGIGAVAIGLSLLRRRRRSRARAMT
ncbi:MAG TPA: GldG family protein [Micropepsaceae bacterium]|nr:GldG family protein [Micropepsaceae bacterium]